MLTKNRKITALALLTLISFSQQTYSFTAWFSGLYDTAARLIATTITCSKEYPKASQAIAGITFFGSLLCLMGWKFKKQSQAHQKNIKEEQYKQSQLKKQESQSKDACAKLRATLKCKEETLKKKLEQLAHREEAKKLQNDRAAQEKLITSLKRDITASQAQINKQRDECEQLAQLYDPENVPQNLDYWLEKRKQEESKNQKK